MSVIELHAGEAETRGVRVQREFASDLPEVGGTIDFRSTPGAGTTFRILLPLIPQLPAEPTGHGQGV